MLGARDAGFGVMLPSFDPFRTGRLPLVEAAELAEELGFDTGWVGDHLSFHPPVLDALCALAAVATRTRRLRLGTAVLLLPLRHLVWTAKQLTTLTALAPDRVLVGLGVGGENPPEWEAAGVPVTERGRRLDEGIDVLRTLLRGEPVDHPGPLLPTRSPALEPAPSATPPLLIGGRSEAAVRRAARVADGWFGVWVSPRRVAEVRRRLDELAVEYARPPGGVTMMVFTHVCAEGGHDDAVAEADRFFRGQYALPLDDLRKWVLIGTDAEVAAGLAELRAAGADSFVLHAAAADPVAQFRRFADVRAVLEG
jgi:alkanesulfonate monooxygenase SsuD/methylene tetrahydromethanopterin reductase-like flavin-dependent oxidoreductase (luciferase family)